MRIQLQCVIQDGSTPASQLAKQKLPNEQRIDVPRGERLEVQLVCVRQDGTAFDLENCNLMLTVRRKLADAEPMFARLAELGDPTDAGIAVVEVAGVDTLGLIEKTTYIYDVQLTDANDDRWQVVPASHFFIKPIVGEEGEIPADPLVDPGAPIAIGPRGYSVLESNGPPDADLGRNFDWAIDVDDPQAPLSHKENDVWVEKLELRGPPGPGSVLSDDDPEALGTADPGDSSEGARSNHVHPHGDQAGGSLHALAVAGVSHGFMSGTMAQQLADLVAADYGGQIADLVTDVADLGGDLSTLTTTVSGHTTQLGTLTSTVAGISADYVSKTRAINTTGPLAGGGDLTGDLTLSIGAADASNAGSMSAADFTKVAGIAALTTKGDFLSHNGTNPLRVPVGANGYCPVADSTEAVGWKWAQVATPITANTIPVGNGTTIVDSPFTIAAATYRIFGQGASTSGPYLDLSSTASTFAWGTNFLRANSSVILLATGGTQRLAVSGSNVLVGTQSAPTGLITGVVVSNGTAPSANPTNSFAMWSASAAANFRGGDNTITTLATYTASHVADRGGGAVSLTVENTSSSALSSAGILLKIPGTSTGTAYIEFERTSGTNWRIENTPSGLGIIRASNNSFLVAPTFVQFRPSSSLGDGRNITISWDASGQPVTGPTLESRSTAAGSYLNIFTHASNATGGVAIAARDTTAGNFKYAISAANRAGPPELKLVQHGGVVLVGGSTAPASLSYGIVMPTAVAPTADTAAGEAALYFDGTDWKTRIGSTTKTFQTV